MATEQSRKEEIVDTAVGAMSVVQTLTSGLDIDDFVSTTVVSKAVNLQLSYLVTKVDPRYVKGRKLVYINGTAVGGY